jgi:multidrug efflux pump subunit AcrA (membrane-fusion protein)
VSTRTERPWLNILLGILCVAAIVIAYSSVGQASSPSTAGSRLVTAQQGVVQSTVSGSGNIQAASQLNLGFKTSGTVTQIDVTQGEYVTQGQLLAKLDPQSAEVTLEQAKANLLSAEANLAKEEETNGASSTGQSPGGSAAAIASSGASSSGSGQGTSSSSSSSSVSLATREANLASARAAVKSDKLTVQSAERAVQETRLYAPESGTIVSLSGQVGETVSGGGTTKASSASSTAGESATSASSAGRAGAASSTGVSSSAGASSSASGGSGSSSSAFAILSDLSSMKLVAPLSESEVGSVSVGQIATVTVEALDGRKLAAQVSEVATLATSDSGVVSYDVTFQLEQLASGLKPGMSATAEVVVKQAEGVNVPTSAITAGAVTVVRDGKSVRQQVVTGLAGNSSTIILSGLKVGEQVALPVASSSASSLTRRITSALGRAGGGLGGAGLGAGGGAAFFRGGG